MKAWKLCVLVLAVPLLMAGLSGVRADEKQEAKIKANLAKLSPADRKLAAAQKWCVVENDDRLGSMDVPVKITIKGQPVFLCCKSCKKEAEADPDKTLAKVKELKAKAGKEKKQ